MGVTSSPSIFSPDTTAEIPLPPQPPLISQLDPGTPKRPLRPMTGQEIVAARLSEAIRNSTSSSNSPIIQRILK